VANTLEIIIKATDKASKEIGHISKGIDSLGAATSAAFKGLAIGAAAVVTAVGAIGVGLGKLTIDAIPLQGIQAAFEGISGASDEMLDSLRKGSLGMVTDRELMRNYNQAAQLVSKTFADQLPDAMKYLAKVSAATGQDMGYMLDSLTKGVGRISPMILDNLGIQVSLAEATEEASQMFGVEADALTKTQLQAGMMNVVMRALKRNTAAMPEIAGTAAQRWAALGVTFKNLKDTIGLATLPILERLMGVVEGLATKYLPPLVDWFENKLVPGIGKAWDRISQFVTDLENNEDLSSALRRALQGVFSEETLEKIIDVSLWASAMVRAIEAGDWSTVGTMLWDQIVAGFTAVVDFGKMIYDALNASNYTFTDAGLVKSNKWADMANSIMLQIVSELASASEKLLDWLNTDQMIAAMNRAGLAIGKAVGGLIAAFFGTPGTTEEWKTGTEIEKMMGRVRDNISAALQQIGREMGGYILEGIIEGITGKAPQAVVQNAIANAEATPPSWYYKFWEAYKKWYDSLPDWATGSVTGQPVQIPQAITGPVPQGSSGPRAEDVYNFGKASGGYAAGLTLVGERGPELVSLPRGSYVHDNRESERMMGGTSVTFGAGAIVIQGNASAKEVEIGVLRGLRAAGVAY